MCILKPLSTNDFRKKNDPPLPINNNYYQRDNDVLKHLFDKMSYNTKAEEVFIKVVIIDFIYSTQLKQLIGGAGVHELVDLILSLDFDARVQNGDPNLVTDIAYNNGGVNLFTFASKYCALHSIYVHKKDDYSIYDSAVARLFPKYTAEYHKNDPNVTQITATQVDRWRQNRDYKSFNDAIGSFLDGIGIDKKTYPWRRSDFDRIVWEQR